MMSFSLGRFHSADLPADPTQRLKRALCAISLANLCYLRIWDVLFFQSGGDYQAATPHNRVDYVAAIIGVGLLATGLYCLQQCGLRSGRGWLRMLSMLAFLLVFMIPLDFIRRSAGIGFETLAGTAWRKLMLGGVAGLVLSVALVFRQRFFAALFWLLAILSPYAAVNLVFTAVHAVFPGEESPRTRLPGEIAEPAHVAKTRVIWIVFDEWDAVATFDRRPANLKLPVLDEFMKHAVVATQAYPPAGYTVLSIPALLTGRLISAAETRGDSELRLKYRGDDAWRDFRASDNIIAETLGAGKKVAVFGWYHPYERILPASPNLTARSWGYPDSQCFRRGNVLSAVSAQYAFLTSPGFDRTASLDFYAEMHAAALAAVADPSIDLVFLHYGIPHLPGIYDPAEHRLSSVRRSSAEGYCNNLVLVDRTLGELDAAAAGTPLLGSTAVILTSDHWWRTSPWSKSAPDHRVPLIIRAPKAAGPEAVERRLCTVLVRRIVSYLLAGDIATNADVAECLLREPDAAPAGHRKGVPK